MVTFLTAIGPSALPLQADESRFSVLGWVKSKLSPEETARSASRSARLRPLPPEQAQPVAPQAPAFQTVAMVSSTQPMPAPGVDAMAAGPLPMNPDPTIPSRPISREVAVQNTLPPPPVSPRQPEPAIGRGASPDSAPTGFTGQRTVTELRRRAEFLATKGLPYKFGGDHPTEGGMDCSGTMQFLLKSMGYSDIPRTSYDQYEWLGKCGTLKKVGLWHSHERAVSSLRPGDLVFWGGTYDSGHKVSHVMVYLGKNRTGTHYVFGARGKKVRGLNGSGVDIFEYKPNSDRERLIGYGRLPGIKD